MDLTTQTHSHKEPSFAELFAESLKKEVKEGEIVVGIVTKILKDLVIVDIGYKSEGAIPIQEFPYDESHKPKVQVGDNIEILLEAKEDDTGHCVLSKEKADRMKIWENIATAAEKDELVEGVVVAVVKGGLSVDIGVKAFLPGSQVDLRPVRNLDTLIGKKFQFKVIKFNKKRGNIVLSRRALLEKERETMKTRTLEGLQEGSVLNGIVKNITDYGAFIDLGGIDGLLHITDMSWGRVNHPSELFHVGDEVRVVVLKYEPESGRVSLGYKQTSTDPWIQASERYPIGTRVKGKVVSLTDYGAFIRIENGIEGLIHISEMSWTKRIKHPSKIVALGDEVEAVVLDIDATNKRISLGMKQIDPNPWTQLIEKYPVGTIIQGKISNITDFGVFVGVEEGIDGLVHISDLSWTTKLKHPSQLYDKGSEVKAVVLNIDVENERFSLGIKQLTNDPWRVVPGKYYLGSTHKAKVMKATENGAFIELEPGVESHLNKTEVPDEFAANPADYLKAGNEVSVVVIDVDTQERNMTVSSKADPADYLSENQQQGTGNAQLGDIMKKLS